ncbi:MAG: NUDIX domain-containing protein [Saprospiraceae bacterium]|nr:NUDIX domain-containing protein [Saprospiraceae bacterium]
MEYQILDKEYIHRGFFDLAKVRVEHSTYDQEVMVKEHEILETGDSVALVLYEKDTGTLLFTEQFRPAITVHDNDWLLEIVAGRIEEGESPKKTIRREAEEEIGYRLDNLQSIGTFYMSPGTSDERIHIYYAEVNSEDRIHQGGGSTQEDEDIRLVKLNADQIKEMLISRQIIDAKTMIGLQWFLIEHSK